jgi:hypothetical protein
MQLVEFVGRYIRGGIGALQGEPRSGRKGNISTEAIAPDRRSSRVATAGPRLG